MSVERLEQIAADERFYDQMGRDGLMEPMKVLLAVTDCEIRRRRILFGID